MPQKTICLNLPIGLMRKLPFGTLTWGEICFENHKPHNLKKCFAVMTVSEQKSEIGKSKANKPNYEHRNFNRNRNSVNNQFSNGNNSGCTFCISGTFRSLNVRVLKHLIIRSVSNFYYKISFVGGV